MRRLLLLALLLCASEVEANQSWRIYRNSTKLQVKIAVHTSNCFKSGTTHNLVVEAGFLNDKNILHWKVASSEINNDDLQRDMNVERVIDVPRSTIEHMESVCASYAAYERDITAKYESCMLNANVVNMRLLHHRPFYAFGSAWRLGNVSLSLSYELADGGLKYNWIEFKTHDNCDYDWADHSEIPSQHGYVLNFYLRIDHTTADKAEMWLPSAAAYKMMFLPLSLLALLPATDAYYYGHHYYDIDHPEKYFIQATYKVQTKDDEYAETTACIKFTFGYVNESTNQLLYYYEDSPWHDGEKKHFDKGQLDEFTDTLEESRYKNVEKACRYEATTRDEYETCLTRPNILFIDSSPQKFLNEWAPDWISITVALHHKNNDDVWIDDLKGTSEFYIKDKWVKADLKYYVRASENKGRCTVFESDRKIGMRYSKCN
ncbi:hypothetical protein QR680_014322 [Steinernema hermaphroditum]|uniref:PLAT domain-containing protein n=1 Tax=Steinernema hermaphroditum TaxID=289476 RepID=A0AA39M416_9BILA|nr:hypothetical protein QR680_014322 [Steinernema hermaphroditum]